MNAVHNNRITTSWFKSSPYSKETRERANKGELSSASRAFVKATENPLRIAGTALLTTALPLIGIKMFSSSEDSPLKSWKTLGTVLLGSASAFIVDTAIPEKSNLEESESLLASQATPVAKVENKTAIINKAAENVIKSLFENLSKKDLLNESNFTAFELGLENSPWQILDLSSMDIKDKPEKCIETSFNDKNLIVENITISGINHKIGIRISFTDIKEAFKNYDNKFRFDVLQDNSDTVIGSITTSLANLGFTPSKARPRLTEEAA